MGSGPKFAKLKKALIKGSLSEVVEAMFMLKFRHEKSKTHGENVLNETERALKHLKSPKNALERIRAKKALDVCKARAGVAWDQAPQVASTVVTTTTEAVSAPSPTK